MSLSMAIPILIKTLKGMYSDLLQNATGLTLSQIATEKDTLAKQKNTLAILENKLAKNQAQLAAQGYSAQEIKEIYATEIDTIEKQKNTVAAQANAVSHMTLASAIKTTTAAL